MCLLAIQYQLVPEAPVLVAANREERYDRPSLPPAIQSGKPRVLCGVDEQAGGTWLGVNQNGMFVAVANPDRLGLFGTLTSHAEVRNLRIVDIRIEVTDHWATGALAGINDGRIASCYSTGMIIGYDFPHGLGGLVG